MNEILLFCLPHAGGTAMTYNQWKRSLDSRIQLIPVELAGRGMRSGESLYSDFEQAVDDVSAIIQQNAQNTPYAIFGHSMGCWMAYEVYYRLMQESFPLPEHLFLSGNYPPYCKGKLKNYYKLSEEKFMQVILKMGGTSSVIMEYPEMRNYYLPIIKNDFRIIEEYEEHHEQRVTKIDSPITIISGKSDTEVSVWELLQWKNCAGSSCNVSMLTGGHFFLFDNINQTVSIVNEKLKDFIGGKNYA